MSDNVQLRAAMYARVSTEDQAREGYSIAAQLKRLRSYCLARGWTVANEYVDDGFSGRSPERPEYKRMMHDKDIWDVVVVLKMDRIHRNSRNFTMMMDFLRSWNKEFNSTQENFDTTTAIGRFVMDTVQRIAQLESEQIGERVKVAMVQKALEKKGHLGCPEPYGYRYLEGQLLIDDSEAQVVEGIFRMASNLCSLGQIVEWLNSSHIPTKNGGEWQRSTVHGILANRMYLGEMVWDGLVQEAPNLKIIDSQLFQEVQGLLAQRMKSRRTPKRIPAKSLFRSEAHA
ncbi:MAG TPA: recombinase family protein [Methanomassiliicoccales archaeon]|nr:recombinase family protein [Methanomassiliicoccales archaeon]